VKSLAERLASVTEQVADAARAADRDPAELTTIVVTKFHPASLVRELADLGVTDFGENRHQDAAPKAAELRDLAINWHFIGQLQSKKARQVAEYASTVHSVDRDSLVTALDGSSLGVFIQVNLTDDASRGGVQPAELAALADDVLATSTLRLLGLMAVAPLDAEPRAAFAHVRELSGVLQQRAPDATALSMGMSGDFREAVLEGATHLRIGTAITGNRPTAP
jgi:pyridoxal phosphate enzyme (YggS family)